MNKPKVFIGSSVEGLPISEAVFSEIAQITEPKIWKHNIFLPGKYPLEALEKELKSNSFAIFIATPDDQLIKRGEISQTMRDNILFEFGIFIGVLGRRRTFLLIPLSQEISIPSDLLGITLAKYDEKRIGSNASEVAAAVQVACSQIKQAISEEWKIILKESDELNYKIRNSEMGKSITKLYDVCIKIRDVLMVLQRDAFEALNDRYAFEKLKKVAAQKVEEIADTFHQDALNVGVDKQLMELSEVTKIALLDLPFPEELDVAGEDWTGKAVDIGMGALNSFLGGRNPLHSINRSAEGEFKARISGLKRRFTDWWNRHFDSVQTASNKLQDALFRASINIGSSAI